MTVARGSRPAGQTSLERRVMGLAGPARGLLGVSLGLGLLAAGATVLLWVAVSRIVDRVVFGGSEAGSPQPLFWLLLAALLARALAGWGQRYAADLAGIRAVERLRDQVVGHLFALGPAFISRERSGELAETVTAGIDRIGPYLSRYLPQLGLSLGIPLLVGGVVLAYDWPSVILLLVIAPLIPLLMTLVGSYAEEHTRRQFQALGRLGAFFLDMLEGIPTLQLFNQSEAGAERVDALSEEFRGRTMSVLRYAFLSGLVLEFMTTGAIAVMAVQLGVRLLDGGVRFQPAFLILLLTPEFFRPLRELGSARHAALDGKAAAERIFAILDQSAPAGAAAGSALRLAGPPHITIEKLTVRYPGASADALADVSLMLPAGCRTALVGPSGAGKSTLLNVLLGFLPAESGRVLVDDMPLSTWSSAAWRRQAAYVPQRPTLFDGSVLENIRLARPGASINEVRRAAELAGALEFIDALPRGFETRLGERGARLSQGQRQRIALARAFLKDAPLLILDEPSSALDPATEERLRLALEELSVGRTVLVVAHRLNTVRTADRIVVLDGGRVVEQGSPAELAARGGLYARLVGAAGLGVPA